jgi:phosphohistidine phosphatase
MHILLVRHGPAGRADAKRWPDDRERPLSPIGRKRTRKAAQGIVRLEPRIDRIWTSPLVRARETAERIAAAYDPAPKIVVVDALAPGMDLLKELTSESRRTPGEVLVLVGHEPDLGTLAGRLVGREATTLPLKKAGACRIDFAGLVRAGAGTLEWFLPPRILRQLGNKKKPEGA